jgi:hypothetical protein
MNRRSKSLSENLLAWFKKFDRRYQLESDCAAYQAILDELKASNSDRQTLERTTPKMAPVTPDKLKHYQIRLELENSLKRLATQSKGDVNDDT